MINYQVSYNLFNVLLWNNNCSVSEYTTLAYLMIIELKHGIKIGKSEIGKLLVLVINVRSSNNFLNEIPNVRRSILDKLYFYKSLQSI